MGVGSAIARHREEGLFGFGNPLRMPDIAPAAVMDQPDRRYPPRSSCSQGCGSARKHGQASRQHFGRVQDLGPDVDVILFALVPARKAAYLHQARSHPSTRGPASFPAAEAAAAPPCGSPSQAAGQFLQVGVRPGPDAVAVQDGDGTVAKEVAARPSARLRSPESAPASWLIAMPRVLGQMSWPSGRRGNACSRRYGSTPAASATARAWSISGCPATRIRGFGRSAASWPIRVPKPAAKTISGKG